MLHKMFRWLLVLFVCVYCRTANAQTLALWNFNDMAPGSSSVIGQRIVDSSGNARDLYASGDANSVPAFVLGDPNYGGSSAIYLTSGVDELFFEAGHIFTDGGSVAGSGIEFENTSQWTFEALICIPASTPTSQACNILHKPMTNPAAGGIFFRMNGATSLRMQITDDTSATTNIAATVPNIYDGKWHHIAAVREYGMYSTTLYLYLDYQMVGNPVTDNTVGSFADITTKWDIGGMTGTSTSEFVGNIDFIRISDAALLPNEFIQKVAITSNPSPANRATAVSVPSVTLGWIPISGSGITLSSQSVQVALDAKFVNILQTSNLSGSASSVAFPTIAGSLYYWRVITQGTDNDTAFTRTGHTWMFQAAETDATVAGYWKFDNVAPGTIISTGDKIFDSSANQRHLMALTVADMTGTKYDNAYAPYGSSAAFKDLRDSQLQLIPGHQFGDGSSANAGVVAIGGGVSGNITIEAVIKPITRTDGGHSVIFSSNPDPNTDSWYGLDTTPAYYFRVANTGALLWRVTETKGVAITMTGSTIVTDANWHHVAAVRDTDARKMRLYIDYELEAEVDDITSPTAAILPDGRSVLGGFNNYSSSRNFNGKIDFVKITRGALLPSQFVQDDAALPTNPNPANGGGPVHSPETLSWTPIAGAAITSQSIVIARDKDMNDVVMTVAAAGNSAVISGLTKDSDYYWRVDSVGSDSGGSFNPRPGAVWEFYTQRCLLDTSDGDLNDDCIVNMLDMALLANTWFEFTL
ncbi:MAG: hypothetical protein A2Y10_12855 [Planctomycetes bacterium GWF2_41_51]|nr:MAG: hypothetical protein A2Y10_12855 [Planctomycetes bacterium GWF2_41_51]HBG28238.1 hypothetical protein [Phycisphaerales bacterium]